MIFPEKKIILKDGRTAFLRSPVPRDDAEKLIRYLKAIGTETPFLLLDPSEASFTWEQEVSFLEAVNCAPYNVMILCFVDGKLAGSCNITRKNKLKNRHRAEISIALYREFWNLGIGTALFREMLSVARDWGVIQAELEVVEGNDRAVALYEKMGFVTIAAVPNAIQLPDGSLRKEYRMIRPL